MKYVKLIFVVGFFMCHGTNAWALAGVLATASDIVQLKEDLRSGKIQIGNTRLKEIRRIYGDASSITDSPKNVTYNYDDLKIEFEKNRYLKEWNYDSFKTTLYTDNIDDLRADLDDGQIVGNYITFDQIRKDYGEPTEFTEANNDGELSTYYYGNVRLVFENYIVVKKWQGKNLDSKIENKTEEHQSEVKKNASEEKEAE
ncbi:MAG TPA: hypothetical protein DD723_00105 [Candidatus Omnitrophica bacterium]|nr:MAG: hypothetical protein A2Z81_07225 [Omnitrophica WOR_2 bacterium GWA2_45_18]HBR13937.1 hypothetical protein [Candidatus Omnitrophota bacterium]